MTWPPYDSNYMTLWQVSHDAGYHVTIGITADKLYQAVVIVKHRSQDQCAASPPTQMYICCNEGLALQLRYLFAFLRCPSSGSEKSRHPGVISCGVSNRMISIGQWKFYKLPSLLWIKDACPVLEGVWHRILLSRDKNWQWNVHKML